MLALVAFLLQRLPADAALPADRRAALPVSFPPALVKCPRIASLGGTFRHGRSVEWRARITPTQQIIAAYFNHDSS